MSASITDLRLSADAQRDWFRNIVSLRTSRHLFESLVDSDEEAAILMEHEMAVKPYGQEPALTHRPFEMAEIIDGVVDAIQWPFAHPAQSRFSAGHFGCWYGGSDLETTLYETGFHFWQDIEDSEASREAKLIVGYRCIHRISCSAHLFDLRSEVVRTPGVYDHPTNFAPCQALGDEAHRDGLPGFLTYSACDPRPQRGSVAAVLNPDRLSEVGVQCYLTYRLDTVRDTLYVERAAGEIVLEIPRRMLHGLSS